MCFHVYRKVYGTRICFYIMCRKNILIVLSKEKVRDVEQQLQQSSWHMFNSTGCEHFLNVPTPLFPVRNHVYKILGLCNLDHIRIWTVFFLCFATWCPEYVARQETMGRKRRRFCSGALRTGASVHIVFQSYASYSW